MEVGIGMPLFESSFDEYGHLLTFCWIKILWQHFWKPDLSLQPRTDLAKTTTWRGFFIMEWLITSGVLTTADEIHFNLCRLAYRAMTMADVMTGDGTKVTKHALEPTCLSWASSKWDWPNECTCNKDILQWWKGLSIITSENLGLPFSLHLERWIEPSHLNWQWFYCQWDWSLYHTLNNACNIYQPFSPCSTVAYPWVEILTWLLVPSHKLEHTTIRYERRWILFEGSASNSYLGETVHNSIYDFIAQLDDSWPLANWFFPKDPLLVIQAIVNDMAVMVSDGSYKPFLSTKISVMAWILECSAMGASCFRECSTSGMRREVNPYHSKVQGCNVGLLGLLAFAIFHQVHDRAIAFHFNNDAGLN